MIDHISSAEKKETSNENTPPLNEVVSKLMQDPEIAKLPEEAQGKVIVDRFIGSLVRHGDVMSSNVQVGAMSPKDILTIVDKIGTTNPEGHNFTPQVLTRTDGLRQAVLDLVNDPRTRALFGRFGAHLKSEMGSNGKERYTLTTEAQLDGYIDAAGIKNNKFNAGLDNDPQEWIGVFMADAHAVASGELEWRTTQSLKMDIRDKGAATQAYYKQAKELYEARSTAHHVGVDIEMVRRSAEYMRKRDELTKTELGERSLFLATGGALQRYNEADEQWFQRHVGR